MDYPGAELLYSDLREKWLQEDELINQRVTWLLQAQAVLITAFGVVAKLRLEYIAALKPGEVTFVNRILSPDGVVELLIVANAVIVMFFLRRGIYAAVEAMSVLKRQLVAHQQAGRIWPNVTIDVLDRTTKHGSDTPRFMAATFFGLWVVVACYEVIRLPGWLP